METQGHRSSQQSFNVTLAATLLDIERTNSRASPAQVQTRASTTSASDSKQMKTRTGVTSLDRDLPRDLWKGGKILGLGACFGDHGSGRHERSKEDDNVTQQLGHDDEVTELITKVVATHLVDDYDARLQSGLDIDDGNASVFLLAPPDSQLITTIYHAVLDRLKAGSRAQTTLRPDTQSSGRGLEDVALLILEKVNVLPYLDLIGLTEVISEVSSSLSSVAAEVSAGHPSSNPTSVGGNIILVIQGLPHALARVVHRSSAYNAGPGMLLSQTAALLTGILRNLRVLSRTWVLNQGKGGFKQDTNVLILLDTHITLADLRSTARAVEHDDRFPAKAASEVLDTSFADTLGSTPRIDLPLNTADRTRGPIRNSTTSTMATTLCRILADSMEQVVLVHDAFGKDRGVQPGAGTGGNNTKAKVVEVVKDVHGFSLGSWTVWDE